MASPTSVNDQVTDSVTQSDVAVVANAPAEAMAGLMQMFSSSLALALENAVANQQHLNMISEATMTKCINYLMDDSKSEKPNHKHK